MLEPLDWANGAACAVWAAFKSLTCHQLEVLKSVATNVILTFHTKMVHIMRCTNQKLHVIIVIAFPTLFLMLDPYGLPNGFVSSRVQILAMLQTGTATISSIGREQRASMNPAIPRWESWINEVIDCLFVFQQHIPK
jgi:hypothetical protein